MSWPTMLADHPELVAEYARHEGVEIRRTTSVLAPCCDRPCAADMVTDVRGVPGIDRDWLCDGCRWRFINVEPNGWSHAQFARAVGAPPKAVRSIWVKEQIKAAERRASERRRSELTDSAGVFNAVEARDRARRHLPPEGEYPPGTEPPGGS